MNPVEFLFPYLERELIEFKNMVEFAALQAGRKNVVRLVLSHTYAAKFCDDFKRHFPDFHVKRSPFGLERVFASSAFDVFQKRIEGDDDAPVERAYYLGELQAVEAARQAEAEDATSLEIGDLYGYPQCCSRGYDIIINNNGCWTQPYLRKSGTLQRVAATANRLATLVSPFLGYHFDYFPCTPTCPQSAQICEKNRSIILNSELKYLVPLVDTHCRALVIGHRGQIFYYPLGEVPADGRHTLDGSEMMLLFTDQSQNVPLIEAIEIDGSTVFVTLGGRRRALSDTSISLWIFD